LPDEGGVLDQNPLLLNTISVMRRFARVYSQYQHDRKNVQPEDMAFLEAVHDMVGEF
jgi:hypothetical protein